MLYDVGKAAALLKMDERTVRRRINRGEIKAIKTKTRYLIHFDEVIRTTIKQNTADLLGEDTLKSLYILRKHNGNIDHLLKTETSTTKKAIESLLDDYEKERQQYFRNINVSNSEKYLLIQEIGARLKIKDSHIVYDLAERKELKAKKVDVNKGIYNKKVLIYDASFKKYLGKDLPNPFFTSREAAWLTGKTIARVNRIALIEGLGRKIKEGLKNSAYLFRYSELKDIYEYNGPTHNFPKRRKD